MYSGNASKPFSIKEFRDIIAEGKPEHLDNFDNANRTQTSVQMTRELKTENGCHVTLIFPLKSRPGVRRRIAEMFVAAAEKGMNDS